MRPMPPRFARHACALAACLLATASAAFAQSSPPAAPQPAPDAAASADGGWQGLARLLEAIKPRVDTRVPPTPKQITDRIEALLDSGQTQAALTEIEKRLATQANRNPRQPGQDVQLAFLHARALAATGDLDAAEHAYSAMTRAYPELPEPWNNLAALYVARGQLERAQRALQTALSIAPQYGLAQANLADVHLLFALRAYSAASELGVAGAAQQARALHRLLQHPQE